MGINLKKWDQAFIYNKKGGYGTRRNGQITFKRLDDFTEKMGWKNVLPETITPKQVRLFLEFRSTIICKRGVQNEASHLRRAISGSGRQIGKIKDPNNNWSTQRLGVQKASRIGGKAAMTLDYYAQNKFKLDENIISLMELQENIGLRRQEAIMAGPSLCQWMKEIQKSIDRGTGAFLVIRDGCKGGKMRSCWIFPINLKPTLKCISSAFEIYKKHGNILQSKNLKSAKSLYESKLRKAGFFGSNSSHSLRRLFAQRQIVLYRESGLSEAEALARLANDLGHGDGRGRWVLNNYLLGGEGSTNNNPEELRINSMQTPTQDSVTNDPNKRIQYSIPNITRGQSNNGEKGQG
jgi:hypothetical protein